MNKIIDKLAWIDVKNNQLLMVRSKGKALFYLPGGKREAGESDEAALVREIKEELSVDLVKDTLSYVGQYTAPADGKAQGVDVQLTCYRADYVGELRPDQEIETYAYLGLEDKAQCSQAVIKVLEALDDIK